MSYIVLYSHLSFNDKLKYDHHTTSEEEGGDVGAFVSFFPSSPKCT